MLFALAPDLSDVITGTCISSSTSTRLVLTFNFDNALESNRKIGKAFSSKVNLVFMLVNALSYALWFIKSPAGSGIFKSSQGCKANSGSNASALSGSLSGKLPIISSSKLSS